MPRSRQEAPALDPIEQDFLAAFKRLQEGAPRAKKLKEKVARGTLKLNFSTVALEAGHSRTLIALESDCRYPRVRKLIEESKGEPNALPTTHTELIASLRAAKIELAVQVKQYQAEALAHFTARMKAEKVANKAEALVSRLRREISAQSKVVHIFQKE